jgi:hypothetical protein
VPSNRLSSLRLSILIDTRHGSDILLLDFILTLKTLLLAADADLGITALNRDTLDLATSASLAGLLEAGHRLISLRVGSGGSGGAVDG